MYVCIYMYMYTYTEGGLFCYFIGYPGSNMPAGLTEVPPFRALLVQRKDGRAYLSHSQGFVWATILIRIFCQKVVTQSRDLLDTNYYAVYNCD